PKYARVREAMNEPSGDGSNLNLEELRAHLVELPRDEAVSAIEQMLAKHIAGIVGVTPAKLTTDKSLLDLGMDSLMLVELRLGLERLFGTAIPAVDLMDAATVQKLALRVLDGLGAAPATRRLMPALDASAATEGQQDPGESLMTAAFERLLEADLDRAKEDGSGADPWRRASSRRSCQASWREPKHSRPLSTVCWKAEITRSASSSTIRSTACMRLSKVATRLCSGRTVISA